MKAIQEEIWFENFGVRSWNKTWYSPRNTSEWDGMQGDHTENIDVCCTTWYIIHDVSKLEFNKQTTYAKEGR